MAISKNTQKASVRPAVRLRRAGTTQVQGPTQYDVDDDRDLGGDTRDYVDVEVDGSGVMITADATLPRG